MSRPTHRSQGLFANLGLDEEFLQARASTSLEIHSFANRETPEVYESADQHDENRGDDERENDVIHRSPLLPGESLHSLDERLGAHCLLFDLCCGVVGDLGERLQQLWQFVDRRDPHGAWRIVEEP